MTQKMKKKHAQTGKNYTSIICNHTITPHTIVVHCINLIQLHHHHQQQQQQQQQPRQQQPRQPKSLAPLAVFMFFAVHATHRLHFQDERISIFVKTRHVIRGDGSTSWWSRGGEIYSFLTKMGKIY